jgi:hypothetical protein
VDSSYSVPSVDSRAMARRSPSTAVIAKTANAPFKVVTARSAGTSTRAFYRQILLACMAFNILKKTAYGPKGGVIHWAFEIIFVVVAFVVPGSTQTHG